MNYKINTPFEERIKESKRILQKYPDRIPIILETDSDNLILDKNKFLVPIDLKMGYFLYTIRKRIKLKPDEGLYMFINNTVISSQTLVSDIYSKNHDDDLFLYLILSKENTFG